MVSNAHVLSASSPDLRDIITRHASGVPEIKPPSHPSTKPKLAEGSPRASPPSQATRKVTHGGRQFLSGRRHTSAPDGSLRTSLHGESFK